MSLINKTFIKLIGRIALSAWISFPAYTQQILLDEPVKAGELTLFRDVRAVNTYYYISDKPRLATENGKPQFSFLRYVDNVRNPSEEVREGEGGGIVHAVVSLSVTEEQLQQARQALRRINPDGTIKGPVIFKGGTIALVSSFANANGELTKQVVGLGTAPILDGQHAAVSVQVTKKGAQILWESFQTPTPDMSVSFEMEVSGYLSPRQVLIEANFDQIYEHTTFDAAVVTPVLAAEIKAAFDELVRAGAIKVTQIGEDENMEKMLEAAYSKLTKMMFDPVGGTGTPDLNQLTTPGLQGKSMLDRATEMLSKARNEAQEENKRIRFENKQEEEDYQKLKVLSDSLMKELGFTPVTKEMLDKEPEPEPEVPVPGFAAAVSFQMKKTRQRGIFTIDLNKYTADNLTLRFDENFGDINCASCFHQVNLDDPLYRQREIHAFLDGMNADDFGKYINFVNVIMRKTHESGDITYDELKIDRTKFNAEANAFKMLYGWKGDDDREQWQQYEFRTVWNFFGGYSSETEWNATDFGTIPLSPPFVRKVIDIEADPDILVEENVRFVEVKVHYRMGEKEFTTEARLNPLKEEFSKQLEIILPKEQSDYDYEIYWHKRGADPVYSGRKSNTTSLLFVDDIATN